MWHYPPLVESYDVVALGPPAGGLVISISVVIVIALRIEIRGTASAHTPKHIC